MLVLVAGDPQTMLPQLRRVVAAVDPNAPISEDAPLTQQVNAVYKHVLLTSAVLTWVGALALFLSMLGLYGVLAFAVGKRKREIGIRMAAYAATRMVKRLLYGVSATDALTFTVTALSLLVVALMACWIPARRATKVDPLLALRCD